MTELEALIAAVDPHDRLPQAVLADWLDDHEIPADTALLRGDCPVWVAADPVRVGRRWSLDELRDSASPGSWLTYQSHEFHGPFCGPGGVFVVVSLIGNPFGRGMVLEVDGGKTTAPPNPIRDSVEQAIAYAKTLAQGD